VVNFKFITTVTYKEISDLNIVFEWISSGGKKFIDLGAVDQFPLVASGVELGSQDTADNGNFLSHPQ
jgi:hypothetical protein